VVLAKTVSNLCIFILKLERASKEPEKYIILSLAERKHRTLGKRLSKPASGVQTYTILKYSPSKAEEILSAIEYSITKRKGNCF